MCQRNVVKILTLYQLGVRQNLQLREQSTAQEYIYTQIACLWYFLTGLPVQLKAMESLPAEKLRRTFSSSKMGKGSCPLLLWGGGGDNWLTTYPFMGIVTSSLSIALQLWNLKERSRVQKALKIPICTTIDWSNTSQKVPPPPPKLW